MNAEIEKICSNVVHLTDPSLVILFGSKAKGTDTAHSDVDLLAVVERCTNICYLIKQAKSYANELSISLDLVVVSPSEMEKGQAEPHSFLWGIVREGKVIYHKGLDKSPLQ
jgi:uncharacterized protein